MIFPKLILQLKENVSSPVQKKLINMDQTENKHCFCLTRNQLPSISI